MESPVTGTEEYYRQRAPEYDVVYTRAERQGDLQRARERVVRLVSGRRVLEVAAGTGWWTDVMADVAEAVLATDVNAETLAVASARRVWPESVVFARHDAFSLGDLGGAFDVAFVGFFWSHVPLDLLDGFLTGVVERVVPGGLLVFIDNRYVPASNHPVARTDDAGNTYQRRTNEDGSEWEVLKNFPSPSEVSARLGRFDGRVTVEEFDYYWLATLDRSL